MGRWAGLSNLIDFNFETRGHHGHGHGFGFGSGRHRPSALTLSTRYTKLDDSVFVLCRNCGHSLKTDELKKMATYAETSPSTTTSTRFRSSSKHFLTWSANAANNRLQKMSKNIVNNVSKLQTKMEKALPTLHHHLSSSHQQQQHHHHHPHQYQHRHSNSNLSIDSGGFTLSRRERENQSPFNNVNNNNSLNICDPDCIQNQNSLSSISSPSNHNNHHDVNINSINLNKCEHDHHGSAGKKSFHFSTNSSLRRNILGMNRSESIINGNKSSSISSDSCSSSDNNITDSSANLITNISTDQSCVRRQNQHQSQHQTPQQNNTISILSNKNSFLRDNTQSQSCVSIISSSGGGSGCSHNNSLTELISSSSSSSPSKNFSRNGNGIRTSASALVKSLDFGVNNNINNNNSNKNMLEMKPIHGSSFYGGNLIPMESGGKTTTMGMGGHPRESSCHSHNNSSSSTISSAATTATVPITSPQWSRASSVSMGSTAQYDYNQRRSSSTSNNNNDRKNQNGAGINNESMSTPSLSSSSLFTSPQSSPMKTSLLSSSSSSQSHSQQSQSSPVTAAGATTAAIVTVMTTKTKSLPLLSSSSSSSSTSNSSSTSCSSNSVNSPLNFVVTDGATKNLNHNNNGSGRGRSSSPMRMTTSSATLPNSNSKLTVTIFEEEAELRHAPWFQAGIPREIALEVLRNEPIGSFIVRESTTKTGCFALSLRVPREFQPLGIAHYLILRTGRGYKIKGFTKEFGSLTSLITHHSVMPELLPCPLSLHRYRPKHAHRVSRVHSSDFVEPEKLVTFRKFTDF